MEETIINPVQELKKFVVNHSGTIINVSKKNFIKSANLLSDEALILLLDQHRDNRNFFKSILKEEYRKEHPNSARYQDAEDKVEKYNRQGKVLKEIIDSRKQ